MSLRTLIIRADASQSIGVGHVLRSLAIAQQWRTSGGAVCFAAAEMPLTMQERLIDEGMQRQMLSSLPGSLNDARELVSLAHHSDASAIVLDGYQYSAEYQSAIQSFQGRTLLIDDNAHLDCYTTDLVLNQNLGATAELYAGKACSSKLLLGPKFALIRDEFRSSDNRVVSNPGTVRNILVTLGGSDPTNATQIVIEGLRSVTKPDLEFRIVFGQLNLRRNNLLARVESDHRFTLLDHVSDMSEQYRWADFAIAAGGSSNWEMCYFGIPRLLLVIAENQAGIAKQLHRLGVAENLGLASNVSPDQVGMQLNAFIESPNRLQIAKQRSMELVDGQGAQRCVEQLSRTCSAGPL